MVSLTGEYALRAMVCLAQSPSEPLTVGKVAQTVKVSPGYLSKVMQQLAKAGLVRSRRGLNGGFTLGRPSDQITLLSVINAVDPFQRILRCPLGITDHGPNLCPLHRQLDDAVRRTEEAFANVTIADVLHEGGSVVPLCGTSAKVALTMSAEPPSTTSR